MARKLKRKRKRFKCKTLKYKAGKQPKLSNYPDYASWNRDWEKWWKARGN